MSDFSLKDEQIELFINEIIDKVGQLIESKYKCCSYDYETCTWYDNVARRWKPIQFNVEDLTDMGTYAFNLCYDYFTNGIVAKSTVAKTKRKIKELGKDYLQENIRLR